MTVSRARPAALALALAASAARAGEPTFGPHDVQTVFFFSKSDDHNRVDYGLKLDEGCMPVGDEPLFPYWREFEEGGNGKRTHTLKFYEYAGYGVSDQQIKKSGGRATIKVQLKALPREIIITTEKGADGKCVVTARAMIAKAPDIELLSCYIKLKTGWQVEYVDVKGKDPKTGAGISERLVP
jgi:hypothetical protein